MITVCVATFGDSAWRDLAYSRAIPSVPTGVPVIHRHGATLAGARNEALALTQTPFLINLDADDELGDSYIDAMSAGTADLRAPAVSYVRDGLAQRPQLPRVVGHRCSPCVADCLAFGNWIVVGACVRTQLLRDIGGWGSEPLYEDWALWRRAWKAGASIEAMPEAVYRAYVNPTSRNWPSKAERVRWTREIAAA